MCASAPRPLIAWKLCTFGKLSWRCWASRTIARANGCSDWLSTAAKSELPAFVKGMQAGGDKLDDVLEKVLGGNRDAFLEGSQNFIMRKYGNP